LSKRLRAMWESPINHLAGTSKTKYNYNHLKTQNLNNENY